MQVSRVSDKDQHKQNHAPMNPKKTNLLKLSDYKKTKLIKKAKASLLKQVSEERLCREFAQIYGIELNF